MKKKKVEKPKELKRVSYANVSYRILKAGKILFLQSERDPTLIIEVPVDSNYLEEYKETHDNSSKQKES